MDRAAHLDAGFSGGDGGDAHHFCTIGLRRKVF
jgi:hypothetical protein